MEQPVEGIDQMAEVVRRVDTPIMADESAWTAQDVIEIHSEESRRYDFNLHDETGRHVQAKKSPPSPRRRV